MRSAEGALRLEHGLPDYARNRSLAAWQPRPCRRVVVSAARRQIRLVVTREILDKYEVTTRRVGQERGFAAKVEPALR